MAKLFVLFFVVVVFAASPALAQGHRTGCSGKTCTEQERNCANITCGTGDCSNFCHTVFQRCMQTGEWFGRHCQMKGLIKK